MGGPAGVDEEVGGRVLLEVEVGEHRVELRQELVEAVEERDRALQEARPLGEVLARRRDHGLQVVEEPLERRPDLAEVAEGRPELVGDGL